MKKTAQRLILVSFVLALISAVTVFLYLESLKKPEPVVEKTTVLVAAGTIPARTLIERDMLKEVKVGQDPIFDSYIKDPAQIVGKYARTTIYQNEGFNTDKLLDTNTDELGLKIESDHRAMSVRVTGDAGVSKLLKPGDFVDIIVFIPGMAIEEGTEDDAESEGVERGKEITRPDEARMILQNIEVLAVNKQINRPDSESGKEDGIDEVESSFLVTLSIPVFAAERLVLAENIGNIKLALRPFREERTVTTKGTTVQDLYVDEAPDKDTEMPSVQEEAGGDYILYQVQRGDTLQKLSEKFYGDKNKYEIIMKANNIKNKDLILTVEVLRIPLLSDREVSR